MLKKILYSLWLFIFVFCIVTFIRNTNFQSFISMIEDKTFDIRQRILAQNRTKTPSTDIIIVTFDDPSYEYILNTYGEWPLPRSIYVKLIDYIEGHKPNSMVLDIMFVKSAKSNAHDDAMLSEVFNKYDNIVTAMNLDNQPYDVRKPEDLPDKLTFKVINNSKKVNLYSNSYKNCRLIIDGIMKNTSDIGLTNVSRSDDGVLRKIPPVLVYKNKYYPQLGFIAGIKYLKSQNQKIDNTFVIDEKSRLKLGDRTMYLEPDGSAILNWYGTNKSYLYIPAYQLLKAIEEGNSKYNYNFKNKVVYIGTSALSLYDIKTVPISKNLPGVEVQATYLNNIIDNNFIHKFGKVCTFMISLIIGIITVIIVLKINSALVGALSAISVYIGYLFVSYYAMKYFNAWLETVYPFLIGLITLIFSYIVKYLIKSKDFDKQYILATTDGLTELYNHRYFKEQMRQMIEQSTRYSTLFSLIILDIDFFKKFNDTYGHQAGDAILKQVAQTLKRNVRSSDIVCRYGGEEMSIILTNTDYNTAVYIAEKICKRIANNAFKLPNGKEASVTISLGVSTFPKDGISVEEMIESADKRLYQAKETGRNKVC